MKNIIKTYVEKRINDLKQYMSKEGIGLAIISSPENVFYFSNFNPILTSHPALMLIRPDHEACLLVHSIRCDHAKKEGVIDNVQLYGKWGANVTLAMHPIEAVHELIGDEPITIGLEFAHLNIGMQQQLKAALQITHEQDISSQISHMKFIKDSHEIDCIKKAAHLTDIGVQTAIECLANGYNEAMACTEGQYKMRQAWHEYYQDYEVAGFGNPEAGLIDSCVVWSMANERIAYGCDCPQAYKPVDGDLVLPMSWAKIGGYSAENERTVAFGQLCGVRQRGYSAMLQARENIYDILRPGTTFEELYLAAAKAFIAAGFGDVLPGRVGHGIGLSAHEHPSLAKGNTIALQPGMTFTVEPGLMTKEWGGARHSDTVLITQDGFEFLTKLDRGLISIG